MGEKKKQIPNAPKKRRVRNDKFVFGVGKGNSRSLALLGMTTFDGATESDGLEEKACLGFGGGFKLEA